MAKIGRLELDVVALTAAFQRDLRRAVDSTNTAAAQMGRQTGHNSARLRQCRGFTQGVGGRLVLALAPPSIWSWRRATRSPGLTASKNYPSASELVVEQLQRLQRAGEQTDVTQEQIATNLQAFVRRLGDAAHGSGQFAEVLKRAGVANFESGWQPTLR